MRTALKSYLSGGTLASGRIAQIEKVKSFKPFDECNTPLQPPFARTIGRCRGKKARALTILNFCRYLLLSRRSIIRGNAKVE